MRKCGWVVLSGSLKQTLNLNYVNKYFSYLKSQSFKQNIGKNRLDAVRKIKNNFRTNDVVGEKVEKTSNTYSNDKLHGY